MAAFGRRTIDLSDIVGGQVHSLRNRQGLSARNSGRVAALPVAGEDQLDAILARFLGVQDAGGDVAVLAGPDFELFVEVLADAE